MWTDERSPRKLTPREAERSNWTRIWRERTDAREAPCVRDSARRHPSASRSSFLPIVPAPVCPILPLLLMSIASGVPRRMMRCVVALIAAATFVGTASAGEWRYESIPILGSAEEQFSERASLVSEDAIRIAWYRGGLQEIRAALSISEAPEGTRVALYIPDAKSLCTGSRDACSLQVQFDDATPIDVPACRVRRDLSLDLREPARFVRELQQSKRVRITLPISTSVPPTPKQASLGVTSVTASSTAAFTFEVAGLRFESKGDEPACAAEAAAG
jgi:hypothetical protein